MPTSTKHNIPEGELSEQAESYVADCLLENPKPAKIVIEITKEAGGTWTLVCKT